jgi:hypothetical protein
MENGFRALQVDNWWRCTASRWPGWSAEAWLSINMRSSCDTKYTTVFTMYHHLKNFRLISSTHISPSLPAALDHLYRVDQPIIAYHNANVKPVCQTSLWHSSSCDMELKSTVNYVSVYLYLLIVYNMKHKC